MCSPALLFARSFDKPVSVSSFEMYDIVEDHDDGVDVYDEFNIRDTRDFRSEEEIGGGGEDDVVVGGVWS